MRAINNKKKNCFVAEVAFKSHIFISKKDNDCQIFELQLLNLAAFHFETY